ncbi:MAG: hypothetical protein H6624_11770 [Bdellovibrionaceae bacterium]|nr:hypothetical protein [Bdellovibrionales bacterium]MCB9085018.1 hypothetical protein [Pseudobdellovibrionaceae bacterium]
MNSLFRHLSFIITATTLAGCTGDGFMPKKGGVGGLSSQDILRRIPTTDKVDRDCSTSGAYSMCLYMKNPVSQSATVLSDPESATELNQQRTFGVKLTGIDGSGKLQNSSIEVVTLEGTAVDTTQLQNYKELGVDDSSNFLEQQMAYYWANRSIEYLSAWTGRLYVKDQGLKVIVDDRTHGWRPGTKSIHLRKSSLGKSMATNGGLVIHLLAQANLWLATGGEIDNLNGDSKHQACGTHEKGCCRNPTGCSRAVASGAADYMVAIMFPDDPGLGEFWSNSLDGVKSCSQSRNLKFMSTITATNAHQACSSSNQAGEVHALGSLYASIWWEVRKRAEEDRPGSGREVDTLYMEHLSKLRGDDDFLSALNKIEQIDAEKFSSRYSSLFRSEYSKRELL